MATMLAFLLLAWPAALPAAVTIDRVWPEKTIYDPNAPARLLIDVANPDAAACNVTLVFDLVSLLDTRTEIARRSINLDAGQQQTVIFDWNTGARDYGHAAVVRAVSADGSVLAHREECFSITDNLWKVSIPVITASHFQVVARDFEPESRLKYLQKAYLDARKYYANHFEFFGWAPDDFFELVPEGGPDDIWRNGTMHYILNRRYLTGIIQAAHDAGLRVVAYHQPFGSGRKTPEMLLRHPDWFLWSDRGQAMISFAHALQKDYAGHTIEFYNPGKLTAASLNFTSPELVEYGLDQIIGAARTLGFEGMRIDNTGWGMSPGTGRDFSGRPVCPTEAEAAALNVRILDRMRERFRNEISPYFVVGNNFSYLARSLRPSAWDRYAADGGMIECEMTNRLFMPRGLCPTNPATRPWSEFVSVLQNARDAIWAKAGHSEVIGMDSDEINLSKDPKKPHYSASTALRTYATIFALASGTHPCSYQFAYGALTKGAYMRFATRYSAFLWDNRLVPLKAADTAGITVTTAVPGRDVLWQNFAYRRQAVDGGEAQTILNLINPPLHPIHGNPQDEYPEPLAGIKVAVAIPAGMAFNRALLLTAEPDVTMTPLAAVTANGNVAVTVPNLVLWDMLVLDWRATP